MKETVQLLRVLLFCIFIIFSFSDAFAQSGKQWSEKKIEKYYSKKIESLNSSLKSTSSTTVVTGGTGDIPSITDKYCSGVGAVDIVPDSWHADATQIEWTITTFVGAEETHSGWADVVGTGTSTIFRFHPDRVTNGYFGVPIYFEYIQRNALNFIVQTRFDYTVVYQVPTIYDLNSDFAICTGESGDLTLTGSENGIDYQLKDGSNNNIGFPINGNGSPIVFTVSPTVDTEYYVEATNSADVSCIATMNNIVKVTVHTPVTTVATNDGPICEGDPLTITATPVGAEYTYAWTGPNGFVSTEQVPIINPTVAASAGNYEVTVTNTTTTCSSIGNTTVVINTIPVPTVSGDQIVCLDQSVTYTTETGMTNYVWSYPSTFTTAGSTTNSLTGTWTSIGVDKIQVVYENVDACTSPVLGELEVTTGEATAGLTSSAVDDESCINQSVTFTATGGVNYEFFVQGISVQGPSSQSTYTTSTLVNGDLVKVKVTDANGCEDTHDGITMTILPEPTIILSASDETPCQDASITLTASGATTYTFYKNGSVVQGPNTQSTYTTVNPIVSGDEFYVIGNDGDCDGTSNTIIITVNPLPVIGLVSDKINDEFCLGDNITFTASNAVTYEFFVDNVSQGASSVTSTFSSTTLTDGQVVKVVGTDANGCEGESSITVNVNEITAVLNVTNPNPPGTSVCVGTEVTFSASATGGSGNYTYEFFVGGVSQGVSSSPILQHVVITDIKIEVIVVDVNLTCTDTAEINMTVLDLPSVSISSPVDGAEFCINDPVTITASPAGYSEYAFYYDDGTNGAVLLSKGSSEVYTKSDGFIEGGQLYVITDNGNCTSQSAIVNFLINDLPTISLSSDKMGDEFCKEESITFTASGGVSYEFFVDGTSVQGPSAQDTYVSTLLLDGQEIKVEGTDIKGCKNEESIIVKVNEATAGLSSDLGTTICENAFVTFTGTGGDTYEFFVNGTSIQGPSAQDTFVKSDVADGDLITVKVVDSNGCEDTHIGLTMVVRPEPSVVLTSSASAICLGEEVIFTATGADEYEFYYNGVLVQGPSTTATYVTSSLNDTDEVYAIGVTATCEGTSNVISTTVNPLPAVNLVSDQPSDAFCIGTSVTFTANGATSYEFFVDGVSQQGPSAQTTFVKSDLTNGQVVSVVGSDVIGCESTRSITVVVNEAVAGLISDIGPNICDGESVTFTATGGASYEFFLNGVSVQGPSPLVTYVNNTLINNDIITVKVIDTNGCEDTHIGITMNVVPLPVVTLSPDPIEICQGEDVNFTANGSTQYEFYLNGISVQGPSSQSTYVLGGANTGDEVYVVGGDGTCIGTSNIVTILVNALPIASISASPSGAIVSGTEVVFTATGGTEYQFYVNGNIVQAKSTDAIYTTSSLNDGEIVSVDVYDVNGCMSSDQITTQVFDGILVSDIIASNTNHCEGDNGVSVSVLTPQTGITYELIKSSDDSQFGLAIEHDGTNPVNWDNVEGTDEYRVEAYYASLPLVRVEMNNRVSITKELLPTIFNLSPTGKISGCNGGTGHDINLDGSVLNVSYHLIQGGTRISTIQGTGNPISFVGNTIVGIYTIEAEDNRTNCSVAMVGQLEIESDGSGIAYDLYVDSPADASNPLDGRFCSGDAGVEIKLSNSGDPSLTYQLFRAGDITPVASVSGNNNIISFGVFNTPGDYTARVESSTGCTFAMNNVVVVQEVMQPIAYSLESNNTDVASGKYCDGSVGLILSLSNSELDIIYELYRDGGAVAVDNQVGTGSIVTFSGPIAIDGIYSVVARVKDLGCSVNMLNTIELSKIVQPNDNPAIITQPYFCIGETTEIVIENPEPNVEYNYYNSDRSVVGTWTSSTSDIVFVISVSGDYEVEARKVESGITCSEMIMSGGPFTITEELLPADPVITSLPATDACDGDVITVVSSENMVTYQVVYESTPGNYVELIGYSIIGDGNDIDFLPINDTGRDYFVVAQSQSGCASGLSNSVNINNPGAIVKQTLSGNGDICDPSTPLIIGLLDSEASVSYTLYYTDPTGIVADKTIEGPIVGGSAFDFATLNTYEEGEYFVLGDNGSCINEMVNRILVTVHTPAAVDLVSDLGNTICKNDLVTFTASGGINYEFFVDGISVQGPSAQDTYVTSSLNDGEVVTVSMMDTNGCYSTHSGITMTVNDIPNVVLTASSIEICEGEVITFEASGATNYEFYKNGSLVQGPGSATTYSDATLLDTDEIYVVGFNGSCMATSNIITITVNSLPVASLVASPSGTIVNGTKVTFTAAGGDEYEFLVDGIVVQGRSNLAIYETTVLTDGQVVSVDVYNTVGCMSTESLVVSVLDNVIPIDVLTSSDYYCDGINGVTIYLSTPQVGVSYELIRVSDNSSAGAPIEYNGINIIKWDNILGDEDYKVEAFYISDPSVKVDMNNTVTITMVPIPSIFDLTPTGTALDCNAPDGHDINLSGSENNVTYYLSVSGNIIASKPGDGNPIVFEDNLYEGIYEISAISDNGNCSQLMNGQYEVPTSGTIYDLFVEGAMAPTDGRYCDGSSGVEMKLDNSDSGVNYQLYFEGVAIGAALLGDGLELSFGNFTDEGSYTVQAETTNGCILLMNNVVQVSIVDVPAIYNLLSDNILDDNSGDYCYGGSGITLFIDNQDEDVVYNLYHDSSTLVDTKIGSNLAGTPLYFNGPITIDGAYTVIAEIPGITCNSTMDNTIVITELSQPQQRSLRVDNSYFCTNEETYIVVESPEPGVSYRTILDGTTKGDWFTSTTGFDLSLPVNVTGSYSVEARNGNINYNCSDIIMTDGPFDIIEESLPSAIGIGLTTSLDPCVGDIITVFGTEFNILYRVVYETTAGNYQELPGYEIIGDGGDMDFDPISDPGRDYYVIAINDKGCQSGVSNSVRIENAGAITKQVMFGDGNICSGELIDDFGLTSSESDVDYGLWFKSDSDNSIQLVSEATVDREVDGSISFGAFFARGDGEYLVIGSKGTCENEMLNRIASDVNPLPIAFPMTGSGITCDIINDGAEIGLEEAESNTEYYIFYKKDSSSPSVYLSNFDTTVDPIVTTVYQTGIYSVVARNSNSCTSNMNGDVTVIEYTDPIDQNLTKTSFCSNEELVISDTELGVYYQVRNTLNEILQEFEGNASGNMNIGIYEAGTYTITATRESVIGTSIIGACYTQMNGGVSVIVNEIPETSYDLTCGGKDSDCTVEDNICIENSQSNIIYVLYRDGVEVSRDFDRDEDGKVCFGAVEEEGNYTILAYDPVTECSGVVGDENGDGIGTDLDYGPVKTTMFILNDDYLDFKKNYNQDTVNVSLTDLFILPLDSCINDTTFGVIDTLTNIRFSLLDQEIQYIDSLQKDTLIYEEKVSVTHERVGTYQINEVTGELLLTKVPNYFGRDTIKYVAKNINTAYESRIDTAMVFVYIGNKYFDEENSFLLPNAFSPNGDGINDLFKITGLELYYGTYSFKSTLEVYNRWGALVYRSKEEYYGAADAWWDGKSTESNMVSLGQDCPNGTYFYIFNVTVNVEGETIEDKYNGYIELRR